jgi:WD40 repeat protein
VVAPIFQRELERLAKPWYQLRSSRVFRDKTNLAADPGLWPSIERALAESDWFILMASREAARSVWVDREAGWWLAHRSIERLVIVLTDGELPWGGSADDVDETRTSALPPVLRDAFPAEPRWVDLRWLRETTAVDRNDPRLRDCVADVVAVIRDTPKDLLIGEHVRQHRRAMRLARGGLTALAVLLVVAVVAAVVAVAQRNSAQHESRVATARQLAALSVADLANHLDLAQLYAVAAYRMDPDPVTFSALFEAVTASPHLVRVLPVGVTTATLAGAARNHVVAGGTTDGRIVRWDLATNALTQVRVGGRGIREVAIDADGGRIVASNDTDVFIWNGVDGSRPVVLPISQQESQVLPQQWKMVAISPSGRTVVAVRVDGSGNHVLVMLDAVSGRELRSAVMDGPWETIGLPDDDTVTVQLGAGSWRQYSVGSLAVIDSGGQQTTPSDAYYCCGFSADAGYFAWAKFGTANVDAVNPHPSGDFLAAGQYQELTVPVPISYPDRFAVATDGQAVAVAGGGQLYVGRPGFNGTAEQLTGTGHVDAMSFVGTDQHELVSATGTTLMFWDLSQTSRVPSDPPVAATDVANAGGHPDIDIAPDGTRIALSGEEGTDGRGNFVLADLTTTPPRANQLTAPVTSGVPVWSADGNRLLLLGSDGTFQWSAGRFSPVWSREPGVPLAARLAPDGRTVVVVSDNGNADIRAIADGAVLRQRNVGPIVSGPSADQVAIGTDTASVAVVRPDGSVVVTNLASGTHRTLPGTAAVTVAFAQDRLLVGRADNALEVWDTAGTQRLRTIPADAGYAATLAVVPETRLVARLTEVGTVEFWDMDSGALVGSLGLPFPDRSTGQPAWDSTVLAAPAHAQELVSASADGAIIRWHVSTDALIRAACTAAGRDLTAAEWNAVTAASPADLTCPR